MRNHDTSTTFVTRDEAVHTNSASPAPRSAAQRQRAYRLRRKRAVIEAIGEEASASRVALLSLLGHELAALENPATSADLHTSARRSVTRILNVIVTRYDIDLTD